MHVLFSEDSWKELSVNYVLHLTTNCKYVIYEPPEPPPPKKKKHFPIFLTRIGQQLFLCIFLAKDIGNKITEKWMVVKREVGFVC